MTSRPTRLLAVTALVTGLIAPSVAAADEATAPEDQFELQILEAPAAVDEATAAEDQFELQILEAPAAGPDDAAADVQLEVLTPGQSRRTVDDVRMPDVADPGSQARNDYATLSGALVTRFAERDGVSVEQFVAANALTGPTVLPGVTKGLDAKALDRQLSKAGLSFDGKRITSLSKWVSDLSAKPSVDAAVTLKASRWADEVSKLSMPALRAPKGHKAELGEEALMFGLFAKESLTSLVANHPDVFDQISRTGVGTPAGQSAFQDSMLQAWGKLDEGLDAGLLDGCTAGFMASMASGDAEAGQKLGGRDCGGCAAAGLAANHMMNRLFDSGTTANSTLFNPGDDTIALQEWNTMQDWVAGAIAEGNPELLEFDHRERPSGVCRSGAAADTVGTVLPDIYTGLQD